VEGDLPVGQRRYGPDLRGADLRGVDLSKLPLSRAGLGVYRVRQSEPAVVTNLDQSNLREAHLEEAWLDGATLVAAHLEGTNLTKANLIRADLRNAFLDSSTVLDGVILGNQRGDLYSTLQGHRILSATFAFAVPFEVLLSLVRVFVPFYALLSLLFALAIVLDWIWPTGPGYSFGAIVVDLFSNVIWIGYYWTLGRDRHNRAATGARLADIKWATAKLAVIDWQRITITGDESEARQRQDNTGHQKGWERRLGDYEAAARSYRQLVVELRARGQNADADVFAYHAQVMQRAVFLRQFKPLAWLGSRFLDFISGYGYRPLRSIASYIITITVFAVLYWCVTNDVSVTHGLFTNIIVGLGMTPPQPSPEHLQGYEAVVVSLTSFHGRGFFQPIQSPGDKVAILAAIEAMIGLVLEITFIATFTQRFFGR
jgi:uncharacterized protein YjbI with pentapeptide repeats